MGSLPKGRNMSSKLQCFGCYVTFIEVQSPWKYGGGKSWKKGSGAVDVDLSIKKTWSHRKFLLMMRGTPLCRCSCSQRQDDVHPDQYQKYPSDGLRPCALGEGSTGCCEWPWVADLLHAWELHTFSATFGCGLLRSYENIFAEQRQRCAVQERSLFQVGLGPNAVNKVTYTVFVW